MTWDPEKGEIVFFIESFRVSSFYWDGDSYVSSGRCCKSAIQAHAYMLAKPIYSISPSGEIHEVPCLADDLALLESMLLQDLNREKASTYPEK